MNILALKKTLPFLLKNKIVPFLWGSQGVGKTQLVKQYADENNLQLVKLYTATQEVGDLIGLLVKDDANKTAYHTRPSWFPTEGKGIIFLDELNRAPNEVIQAMFSFVTEGRLHTHQLPEGWVVVAAGNYQSDRFTTTDTSDAAWLSRFCHLDFTPTVEEWLIYAETKGLHDLASFIREQPSMLELSAKDAGRLDTSFITPDRRAWLEGVGRLEKELDLPQEVVYEVYSGLVGTAAAAAFLSNKAKAEKSLSLGQILSGYEGRTRARVQELSSVVNERRFDILNQPIDELITKIELTPHLLTAEESLNNIKKFFLDIPKELSMKAFTRISKLPKFSGKNSLLNDPEYVKLFV